jgi:hypothetical protein
MSQTLVDPDFSYSKSIKTPTLKFHSTGSDSDTDPEDNSDDEESTRRYVRQALSSDASMAPEDVLEALQKSHTELSRRMADSERRMQNRLAERETEIADLEAQLDDLKNELGASRREEKELRIKERGNMTLLASLESDMQKVAKTLENSRAQYVNMQKQYQEQCGEFLFILRLFMLQAELTPVCVAETERMRNVLRRKEQELKEADDRAYLHEGEIQKVFFKIPSRPRHMLIELTLLNVRSGPANARRSRTRSNPSRSSSAQPNKLPTSSTSKNNRIFCSKRRSTGCTSILMHFALEWAPRAHRRAREA